MYLGITGSFSCRFHLIWEETKRQTPWEGGPSGSLAGEEDE